MRAFRIVVNHQRINGASFVFSAVVPALLAFSGSEGINILRNTPSILNTLQEKVRDSRGPRPYRHALDPLAHNLADHPHPPTYRDAVVRHCGRGGPLAGHRGRGARVGRVDHNGSAAA